MNIIIHPVVLDKVRSISQILERKFLYLRSISDLIRSCDSNGVLLHVLV